MVKNRCCMYLICYLTIVTCVGCGQSENTPPTAPNLSILTIEAKPTAVAADAYSTITATLKTSAGAPITGEKVTIDFNPKPAPSGGTIQTLNDITDIKGNATSIYKSGSVKGVDIIQATYANADPKSVAIYVAAPDFPILTIEAKPTAVVGVNIRSAITATLQTNTGTPISGANVNIQLIGVSVGSITPGNNITNIKGIATATYTSPGAKVTAIDTIQVSCANNDPLCVNADPRSVAIYVN